MLLGDFQKAGRKASAKLHVMRSKHLSHESKSHLSSAEANYAEPISRNDCGTTPTRAKLKMPNRHAGSFVPSFCKSHGRAISEKAKHNAAITPVFTKPRSAKLR